MRNPCLSTIDYKMKLDPIYYKEKNVDHYGQRGMSWHGYMIQYYAMKYFERTSTTMLNKFYLDHIVDNKNKQDKFEVFFIVEVIILAIKKEMPYIEKIPF
jgi:hypothetical protein